MAERAASDRTKNGVERQVLVAAVATALGTVARVGVYQLVGTRVPYLTFFPAVIVAGLFGGTLAAVLTTVATAVIATLWMEPVGVLRLAHRADYLALGLYVATAGLIVFTTRRADVARAAALRAAREAAEAGELARGTLESISDALMILDADWRIEYLNPAAERINGVSLAEVKGRDHWELYPAAVGTPLEAGYRRAVESGEAVEFENYYEPWGRWFFLKAYPRKQGGIAVYYRDVTERKRAAEAMAASERRLAEVLDLVPVIVWTSPPDGHVDYFSRAWTAYTGLTREETYRGGWEGVIHADDVAGTRAAWGRAMVEGTEYRHEHRIRGRDGRYEWFSAMAVPLKDASGRITKWFGTAMNVEDAKRVAIERQQLLEAERAARGEAERVSRMKDEFLATLSHELRTPLNSILGWSQILRGHDRTEEDLEVGLETIERNARVQRQLIEDLLDTSRIVSGKVRLEVRPTDVTAAVEAAVQAVRPSAEAKGVELRSAVEGEVGLVMGDAERLQQVVWNLLSNAVKFTPRGGWVDVRTAAGSAVGADGQVEVTVRDTGAGIAPAFLPHVFERFRQADASSTRRHGGLGLGLAIVKQLTELHGGHVRAESEGEGRGATFVVSLPVMRGAAGDAGRERASAVAGGRETTADLSGVTVLIVDDEADARAWVRRMMEECGATVLAAASAEHALRQLVERRPDVLVSDLGMPGRDGYQLIRDVRALAEADGGRTPAIALTAFAREEDRARAVAAGYQVHLSKPVEAGVLIGAVAKLSGRGLGA